MSILTRRVVHWASQECYWQGSGEMSVAWMIEGWTYAHRNRKRLPTAGDIMLLGRTVEPRHNSGFGFRRFDVRVVDERKLPWESVDEAIDILIERTPALTDFDDQLASDWFRQYEDIHPFADGNGRTGSILYNWLRGSLPEPIHPPNLWDDPGRVYDEYPKPII